MKLGHMHCSNNESTEQIGASALLIQILIDGVAATTVCACLGHALEFQLLGTRALQARTICLFFASMASPPAWMPAQMVVMLNFDIDKRLCWMHYFDMCLQNL